MKAVTLKALQESIEHWKRFATGKRTYAENELDFHKSCALCQLYNINDNKCKGCPVRARTRRLFCRNTPYEAANNARDAFGLDSPEFRREARRELAFLRTLLPK